MERSLTLLNSLGDLTLTWEPDKDDEFEKIIEAQMKKGVKFFIIKPFSKEQIEIKSLDDVVSRSIIVKDDDVLTLFNRDVVVEGVGKAIKGKGVGIVKRTKNAVVATVRAAKSAKDAAKSHSVGVKPLKAG